MATSGENKTGVTKVDSTTALTHSSSKQHEFFAGWLQTRDSSIQPPKESGEKSACSCHQGGGNERHGFRCPHHHTGRISNHNLEDQNRAKSAISKPQSNKEPNRTASAHCTSSISSTTSNEQRTSPEKSSKISSSSVTNKKPGETKSKIPIRIPETILSSSLNNKRLTSANKISKIPVLINNYHSLFPKQHAVIDQDTLITSDEENHHLLDHDGDDDVNQNLLTVNDINDPNKNNIKSGETKSNSPSVVAPQLDTIEQKMDFMIPETLQLNTTEIREKIQINVNNDSTNDNYKALKQKQDELKAYYDSFPSLEDVTNETCPDIIKAKEFTASILRHLPSGDVDDTNTVCHVLNKLLGNENQGCLFYDSENGVNLHDASLNLTDINSKDKPFVLKLHSSEGLGNRRNVQTEQDDLKLVQILTNIIQQNESHPLIDDITERLSKAHGVDKKSIIIKTVFVGTFNIVYTVMDLASSLIKSFVKIERKLMKQFKQFYSLKIHPLLFRPSFDIAYFDKRGHKAFSDKEKTFQVGPPSRTQLYTQAVGWTRYGLKVLGKYENDNWLHPFQHPENWYRAFHGTGRAKSEDFDDKNQPCDDEYASVDALSSIFQTGFREARVHRHGEGVYCSPDPKFPERRYVSSVPLDTQQGDKTFKCMLQVAVNPNGVKFTKHKEIWVVPDPKDIRPYGILIKEA